MDRVFEEIKTKLMVSFVNKYDQILFLWCARETPLRFYKDLRRHIAENYFIEEFETEVEGRFCTEFRRRWNEEDVQILKSMLTKYTVCISQKREEMFEIVKCISIAFLKISDECHCIFGHRGYICRDGF